MGLVKSGITKYRVKAIVNGFESDWSGDVEVSRSSNGIHSVSIDNEEEAIYSIDGLKRSHPIKGINIIKGNGKTRKILVE